MGVLNEGGMLGGTTKAEKSPSKTSILSSSTPVTKTGSTGGTSKSTSSTKSSSSTPAASLVSGTASSTRPASTSTKKLDLSNPSPLAALDSFGTNTGTNPVSQFIADSAAHRDEAIARRSAAGVTPSGGMFDWNGLFYDMNAPYRDRVARETQAFDAAAEVDAGHAERLLEAQKRAAIAAFANPRTKDDTFGLPNLSLSLPSAAERAAEEARMSQPSLPRAMTPADRAALSTAVAALPAPRYVDRPNGTPLVVGKDQSRLPQGNPGLGIAAAPMQLPMPASGGIDQALAVSARANPTEAPVQAAVPAEEPTVWDRIVDGASGIAGHSLLGSAVKALFPDMWAGAEKALKDFEIGDPVDTGPSWYEQVTDPLYEAPDVSNDPLRSLLYDGRSSERAKPVPPTPTPPVGTPTPNTPPPVGTPAGQRRVVFPQMPPYNPGRSNEWTYFLDNHLANGGIVGYAEGGEVEEIGEMEEPEGLDGEDPRVALIADTEDVLEALASGRKPDKQDEAILRKFVDMFGDTALRQLNDNVKAEGTLRGTGRLVRGAGGPKDDAIPARINGTHEARLSDGEFVVPADAVAAAGEGDHDAGAQKLQELSNMLQGVGPGQPLNVEQVG